MLSEEQLQQRTNGIGGSEVSIILGLNPWKTPLQLYMEKIGELEPVDLTGNQNVHFGNVLEDVIAQEYARRNNVKVRRRNSAINFPGRGWAFANVDRTIDGQKTVLECKSADKWTSDKWGDDGTDQAPDYYLTQVVWYMKALNYPQSVIAVLIGGNDFRQYPIERSPGLEDMVYRKAKEFWFNHVLARNPPEPTNDSDLALMYARDNGDALVASEEIEKEVYQLSILKYQVKALNKQIDEKKFLIEEFMAEYSCLLNGENDLIVTHKKTKDGTRFNAKRFQKAMPNLAKEYSEHKKGHRVFLLKV